MRRTVSVDMIRPDGPQGRLQLIGRGRDLRTGPDSRADVVATAAFEAEVDYAAGWLLRSLQVTPPRPALQALLGVNVGSGFRRKLLDADPGLPVADGLLHQLLDDVPVTTLVSGHAYRASEEWTQVPRSERLLGRALFGRDMCAGFATGGTIMVEIDAGEPPPLVTGPAAGELRTDDPLAWHELPPLPVHGMRRVRRTDVVSGAAAIRADILYRDSYVRADGVETVIHEYDVELTSTSAGTVRSIRATPRVLPWTECPVAAASADRLVGLHLSGLRQHVRATFGGTSTCTHLNDTLRSLEDVPYLLDLVSP